MTMGQVLSYFNEVKSAPERPVNLGARVRRNMMDVLVYRCDLTRESLAALEPAEVVRLQKSIWPSMRFDEKLAEMGVREWVSG